MVNPQSSIVNPRSSIVLASGSPRRRQLLAEAGYAFRAVDSDVRETPPEPGVNPRAYAEEMAVRKARRVASQCQVGRVIGADTVVELGGRIIGKPADPDDARRILTDLSGSRHSVVTGVCVWHVLPHIYIVGSDRTFIRMRRMSPADIDAYVASGEALGKAGAYAIQESGDTFIESVEGSFTNVVGLPMELLAQMLAVQIER
jgi:septum formation protein